jgi:ribosomal protein S18 acetylase RimI-like enzyme
MLQGAKIRKLCRFSLEVVSGRDEASEKSCMAIYNQAMQASLGGGFIALDTAQWNDTFDQSSWSQMTLAKGADGEVVGFALVCAYGASKPLTLLQMLAVDPKQQGSGAGAALLGAVLDSCAQKGARLAVAYVRESARGAQAFYRSQKGRIDYAVRELDIQGEVVHPVRWALAPKAVKRLGM